MSAPLSGGRAALSVVAFAAAFVTLVHCGDDDPKGIECTITNTGKSCSCKVGREPLGFCSEQVLGVPSVCCAQAEWPNAGVCTCDLVVCVSTPGACKCSRSTQRLEGGEEVAECPQGTSDATRCCVDRAGNCGCYPKTADQCGEGAADVDQCDYFKAQLPCTAGERAVKTCEQ